MLGADTADGDFLDVIEAAISSPLDSFFSQAEEVDVTDVLSNVDLRSDPSMADTSMAEVMASATAIRRETTRAAIYELDRKCILLARKAYPMVTRSALFIVFFWFGFIKLLASARRPG